VKFLSPVDAKRHQYLNSPRQSAMPIFAHQVEFAAVSRGVQPCCKKSAGWSGRSCASMLWRSSGLVTRLSIRLRHQVIWARPHGRGRPRLHFLADAFSPMWLPLQLTPGTGGSRAGSGIAGFSRPESGLRYRLRSRPRVPPRPGKLPRPQPGLRSQRAARG
jgi:hypothetical protein